MNNVNNVVVPLPLPDRGRINVGTECGCYRLSRPQSASKRAKIVSTVARFSSIPRNSVEKKAAVVTRSLSVRYRYRRWLRLGARVPRSDIFDRKIRICRSIQRGCVIARKYDTIFTARIASQYGWGDYFIGLAFHAQRILVSHQVETSVLIPLVPKMSADCRSPFTNNAVASRGYNSLDKRREKQINVPMLSRKLKRSDTIWWKCKKNNRILLKILSIVFLHHIFCVYRK